MVASCLCGRAMVLFASFQSPNLVKLHSSEIPRYGCTLEASLSLTSEFFVVKDPLCCVAHTWWVSSRDMAPS